MPGIYRKGQRGQSALEFAIMLPLLMVPVLMLTTFGMITYAKLATTLAAREGARTYAILANNSENKAAAIAKAKEAAGANFTGLIPSSTRYFNENNDVVVEDVSLSGSRATPDANGEYCRVIVKARVPLNTPWFRRVLGSKTTTQFEGSDEEVWNQPLGVQQEGEYVFPIQDFAVFKKEPQL